MLIIGNGESRKNFNVNNYDDFKIGCNAIFRDYKVSCVSCCDRRMVTEAINSGINEDTVVYTRSDWMRYFKNQNNVKQYPDLPYTEQEIRADEPFQWGSGPYAVLLGATMRNDTNHLIGFDCHGAGEDNKKFNNIYKDTKNYNSSDYRAIDPSYWIYQIGKVIECFPDQRFIFYNNLDWELPPQWQKPNVYKKSLTKLR
jgi:hypothetical protein